MKTVVCAKASGSRPLDPLARLHENSRNWWLYPGLVTMCTLVYNVHMTSGSASSVLPADLNDLPRWLEGAEGFSALIASLQAGQAAMVDGTWNSAAPLVAATLGLRAPSTLLIVLAHPRDLDAWDQDLLSFSGIHSVTFPAWDALPNADTLLDDVSGG